jgi:hypothetical protein
MRGQEEEGEVHVQEEKVREEKMSMQEETVREEKMSMQEKKVREEKMSMHWRDRRSRPLPDEDEEANEQAPRSLVFLLDRPACMSVRPQSLPYLSRDVHGATKGYLGHNRLSCKETDDNLRSTLATTSHLSSTACSSNRQRGLVLSSPIVHKRSRDGIKNRRLRMLGTSGCAYGSSLDRQCREMTALLMPKRSKDRVLERTLQQTKSTTYMQSSSGEQQQSRTGQHQTSQASPVRVSPEMQSLLRREALRGHMILSLDRNCELALSGTLQKASMYDLSNPFGRARTFQAFGSQSGSDAGSGAQSSQWEKSRRRESAKAECRQKCVPLVGEQAVITDSVPGRQGSWMQHSQGVETDAQSLDTSDIVELSQQRIAQLPASIHWSAHDPRSRAFGRSRMSPVRGAANWA